jgi:hypothetical protein
LKYLAYKTLGQLFGWVSFSSLTGESSSAQRKKETKIMSKSERAALAAEHAAFAAKIPERKVFMPHITVKRVRKGRRNEWHPVLGQRYSVAELQDLLQGGGFIWGFDPVRGRADLLDRSKIEEAALKYSKRSVRLTFGFEEGYVGILKLIPTPMLTCLPR